MIFTHFARVIAYFALVLGLLRILTAVFVLLTDDPAQAARALLGSKTTGQAIDQGLYTIVFAVLLGVLVEISQHLSKAARRGDQTS